MPDAGTTAILFALPEEWKPFERVKPASDKFRSSYSGSGAANSRRVASQLIEELGHTEDTRTRALLICGFAGGLVDGLTPGTLVIGDSVTDSSGMVLTADSRLLAIAESVRLPELAAMRGTIYTNNKVLTQSVEKRALAQSRDVIAVDMETFAAAQTAQQAGVPWLAIRVVTDGAADDMPFDFNAMTAADGNVNKGRVIVSALTHPRTIPALIRLGARSSLAAKNLAHFLEAYLKASPDVNV